MMRPFVIATVGLTAAVAFLVGLLVGGGRGPAGSPTASPPSPREFLISAPPLPGGAVVGTASFADVAEHINPAVVNIDATSRGSAWGGNRRFTPSLPERPDMFDRPFQRDREEGREGLGTGFVFDPSGLILTSQHVIAGAERVTVRLAGGRLLRAAIVGADVETDIAVLKVDAGTPLAAAPLGDSDRLRVGEWVCAIGNPLAYEHSVTVGVVSFIGRKLSEASLERYIQTDAAINLGNSGGPLINARGEVIGINAAVSAKGSSIGFAVPINQAREILPALLEYGRVSRGYLGLTVQPLTPDLRRSLGLGSANGALVQDVEAGSPADRAGVQPYDVIVDVEGEAAGGNDQLVAAIAARRPGTHVSLQVVRDGRPMSLVVKLAERPGAQPVREASGAGLDMRGPALGLFVRELDREFRMRYRVPDDWRGVIVSRVEPLSPASDAEIARGHVVLEINRHVTATVDDFRREVASARPGEVLTFFLFNPDRQQRELRTVRAEP
jgi:serine protease Do